MLIARALLPLVRLGVVACDDPSLPNESDAGTGDDAGDAAVTDAGGPQAASAFVFEGQSRYHLPALPGMFLVTVLALAVRCTTIARVAGGPPS